MAITNAQQYQQLVNKPAGNKRPGYRGSDMASVGTSTRAANTSQKDTSGADYGGGNQGRDAATSSGADDRSSALQTYNTKKATGRLGRQDPMGGDLQYKNGVLIDETGRPVDDTFRGGFTGDLTENEKTLEKFIDSKANYPSYTPAYVKFLANLNRRPNRKYFIENVLRAGKIPGVDYSMLGEDEFDIEKAYDTYMANRLAGKTDAMGNPTRGFEYGDDGMLTGNFIDNGGGDNNYVPPVIPEDDTTEEDPTQLLTSRILGSQFDPTFFANEGGRAALAEGGMPYEGGIMDLESGRQMYFLGKLVKKATRAVKKIAKSPIGKVALFAAPFAMSGGSFGAGLGKFFGKGSLNPFLRKVAGDTAFSGLGSILSKAGLVGKSGLPTLKGGLAFTSLLPFLAGKEEGDDFDIDAYYAANQLTPGTTKRQMGSEFDFYKYNLAEGGMPSKEPVAKKTMPLIDMDGQEMDLRAEGGFVPIGRMERADDVPARLSKNEFVFTADAVRNAGDGDIDKGAEVMYNMMKNLESGGEVSEESQGLNGAREMFKTSQRLEEVL